MVTPPRASHAFGMHPALPSTLVFAAFTLTALAVASAVDAVSTMAQTAAALSVQLRTSRWR